MISLLTSGSLLLLDRVIRPLCHTFRFPEETSNRITCIVFQVAYVATCIYGFMTSTPDSSTVAIPFSIPNMISHTMAGYFFYDLLFLSSLPTERKQPMFVVHHIVSLCMYVIYQIHQPVPDRQSFLGMILLESSSPLVNLWNIAREKKWAITSRLFTMIKWSFGLNRLVGLSVWLYWYYHHITSWTWYHIGNGTGMFLVYLASIHWFIKMCAPRVPHERSLANQIKIE